MLPMGIYSGVYHTGHCQGIAVDDKKGFIYYSFTTSFVKTDLNGDLIGSVCGLVGHLGCIDFNTEDGLVYGSLEYKDDGIGKGILQYIVGKEMQIPNAFYCAIFDVDKIDRPNMDATKDGVMKCAFLKEVTQDYCWEENGVQHRHGCSGIDGTATGPIPGTGKDSKKYTLIAYGIYGDVNRDDNDDQVIVCYDPAELKKTALPLEQQNMHTSGPEKPFKKLFARTGNTVFGIQNLEYDENTGDYIAAVYRGQKPIYANKPMYIFDGSVLLPGDRLRVKAVSDFPYGQTGVCALDGNRYYFSHDSGDGKRGWDSTVKLYTRGENGFELVK